MLTDEQKKILQEHLSAPPTDDLIFGKLLPPPIQFKTFYTHKLY